MRTGYYFAQGKVKVIFASAGSTAIIHFKPYDPAGFIAFDSLAVLAANIQYSCGAGKKESRTLCMGFDFSHGGRSALRGPGEKHAGGNGCQRRCCLCVSHCGHTDVTTEKCRALQDLGSGCSILQAIDLAELTVARGPFQKALYQIAAIETKPFNRYHQAKKRHPLILP